MAMAQSSSASLPSTTLRSRRPFGETCCLREEGLEFGKDGSVPIRLEVHLVAANVAAHKTGSGQLAQLALYSSYGSAGVAHQLAEVVRFVSVAQQPSKHAPARAAEELLS